MPKQSKSPAVQVARLRPGTRIETLGFPAFEGFPGVAPERATILKPRKENLPAPGIDWHVVRFEDGGKLYMHESNFRVVSNS